MSRTEAREAKAKEAEARKADVKEAKASQAKANEFEAWETKAKEDDAMEAEVDWSESPSPIVSKSSQWVGAMAATALSTGQALRQVSIKPAQVFQIGAQVRVLAQGLGFTITSDGQAMSVGVVGQLTQVKMENGRILSGVVVDNRTVRLNL